MRCGACASLRPWWILCGCRLGEGWVYAETCATIGVVMLAERLLQLDTERPDRRYADVMELCLYKNIMTAMCWKPAL
ncbi:hypothetical protein B0T25DRAFT_552095 [Lasiosphaeria hispida]|uniref:Non-reducing end beta-L-arabinofuranosidase-like GH127 catalytic domain-containing protein n=1 Tax=Lasiosphaeria hispida TaxID=260671 RepID=A0AAJ0MAR4_9PEZI|nr:hypothetical protein B0T25DRAFT_552095 [Lasiosphaeria hispida]